MKAWDGWFHEIGGALKTAATRSRRHPRRSAPTARSATRAPLHTGHTIVQADSLDTSTTIAKGSPVLQGGGTTTVYETFEVA